MPSFSTDLKHLVIELVKSELDQFDTNDKLLELFNDGGTLLEDEGPVAQKVREEAVLPEVATALRQNLNFYNPPVFPSTGNTVVASLQLQSDAEELVDLFDEFITYAVKYHAAQNTAESDIESLLNKFETDFFADEIEVTFIAQLQRFFPRSLPPNLISDPETDITYLGPVAGDRRCLFYAIKDTLESERGQRDFLFDPKEFSEHNPIVLEHKKNVRKNRPLAPAFDEVRDIFEKITFILRLIEGGSAQFEFIYASHFGNMLGGNKSAVRSYPLNHGFSALSTMTGLGTGPQPTWFKRAWDAIRRQNFAKWEFANQKVMDSFGRRPRRDAHLYSTADLLKTEVERIVDLAQALENTIGGFGGRTADYVAKLVDKNTRIQRNTQANISIMYRIRNAYLHGDTKDLQEIFHEEYGDDVDRLAKAIDSFEYKLRRVLLASITDSDLRDKVAWYHARLDALNDKKNPRATPVRFPRVKTVFYR